MSENLDSPDMLKARREAAGLKAAVAAAAAGITTGALWSIEHGKMPRGGESTINRYKNWLLGYEEEKVVGVSIDNRTGQRVREIPGGKTRPKRNADVLHELGKWSAGDVFKSPEEPRAVFIIRGFARTHRSGHTYVDCYGGLPKQQCYRSFPLTVINEEWPS